MKKTIADFFSKHKTASICCIDNQGLPHCFSCFYAFYKYADVLIFKSGAESLHAKLIGTNKAIAGTILPDRLNLLAIRGIQFKGIVISPDYPQVVKASIHYYKKFPYATAITGSLWAIQLTEVKMTDNTLGFGNKTNWYLNKKIIT